MHTDIRWGVSPAYHISRYSDRFRAEDVAASLPDLVSLGFSAFQLEVFHPETLDDWAKKGIYVVANMAEKTGIFPSQFVGHFLLHGFSSAEALESDFGISEIKTCAALLKSFPNCGVITAALPAFAVPSRTVDAAAYQKLWKRFIEKIKKMAAIAQEADKQLALEIMPGSILGGLQGFVRLIESVGSPNLGYNFDTGHAWACREVVELIPALLGNRIFGAHLKDNCQTENFSLAPGRGTIPWDALIKNLYLSGYRGSWDIEIKCERESVGIEYAEGLSFLQKKINSVIC